jgi:ferritin
MVSKKMAEQLNQQVNLEFFSSNVYLQMSAWAETNRLSGCAAFLKKQAAEEMMHMMKIFDYVNETDHMAVLGKIDAPATSFKSVEDVFQKVYEHEKHVTKKIHEIAELAWKEKDLTTFNFMQWFITEQHEEETQAKGILDKIELIGSDKKSLFMFDNELGNMAAARPE